MRVRARLVVLAVAIIGMFSACSFLDTGVTVSGTISGEAFNSNLNGTITISNGNHFLEAAFAFTQDSSFQDSASYSISGVLVGMDDVTVVFRARRTGRAARRIPSTVSLRDR